MSVLLEMLLYYRVINKLFNKKMAKYNFFLVCEQENFVTTGYIKIKRFPIDRCWESTELD